MPPQCSNYTTLTSEDRLITNRWDQSKGALGDKQGCGTGQERTSPQWMGPQYYRFDGPTMKKMAVKQDVEPEGYCHSWASGHIEDSDVHNLPVGESYSGVRVCFAPAGNPSDCQSLPSTTISVTHCHGGFFIYELPDTPYCSYRYCGGPWTLRPPSRLFILFRLKIIFKSSTNSTFTTRIPSKINTIDYSWLLPQTLNLVVHNIIWCFALQIPRTRVSKLSDSILSTSVDIENSYLNVEYSANTVCPSKSCSSILSLTDLTKELYV